MNTNFEKILNKEITFVIQGPIIKGSDINKKSSEIHEKFTEGHINEVDVTKKSCESIRKYFPESKIILSTWKNSNSEDLNFDTKIESADPGATNYYYKDEKIKKLNNINRMLVSSYKGLISVKTKFSVKLRSDMYFQSNNLSKLLGIINSSNCSYARKKIIIPSNMALNPDREYKLLFHPSDTFFAGLTEDLVDLFNIPLMDDEQMTYFKNNKNDIEHDSPILGRYTGEQYLFYSYIKNKIKINFENAFDFSKENKLIHDKVFSNLFAMFRTSKIGLNCYKFPMSFFSSTSYYAYTEYEFNKLSGKQNLIDFERLLSNIIKILKLIILFFSKNLYSKIKNYFIKKI
tara:strand:- start:6697 stop:7734 length:1038 start_codon:yes stop_codon:yes gene_type:complete